MYAAVVANAQGRAIGPKPDVCPQTLNSHLSLIRSLATDGGKVWKEKVYDNEMSFEGVFNANSNVDIIQAQALAKTAKQEASK